MVSLAGFPNKHARLQYPRRCNPVKMVCRGGNLTDRRIARKRRFAARLLAADERRGCPLGIELVNPFDRLGIRM